MKRLLVLVPAVLLTLPAFAQTAPEGSYRDLWCGIAFGSAPSQMPNTPEEVAAARAAGDAGTEEQKGIVAMAAEFDNYVQSGAVLVARAATAYAGAGFTDVAFETLKTDLTPKVLAQISGTTGQPAEFGFDECLMLAMPEGDAPAPEAPAADPATPAAPAN